MIYIPERGEDDMCVTISFVVVNPDDLYSLADWLRRDDEFRGRIEVMNRQPDAEQMGALTETLTVGLGSGGAVAVLAGSLSAWLSGRRARVSVEVVSGTTTRRVEIDASDAVTVERLLRQALESTGESHDSPTS